MNTETSIRYGIHALGLICSVVVLGAGYLVGYVPRMAGSQSMGVERLRVEKLASALPTVRTRNEALAAECDALQQELDSLILGVPQLAHEHELFKSFSDLAEQCDMKLLDFTPSAASKEGEIGVTTLQMGFRGDYDSTCELLWELDNMVRLHRISSVTLRPIDRTNGIFEIRFEMRAFHGRLNTWLKANGSAA